MVCLCYGLFWIDCLSYLWINPYDVKIKYSAVRKNGRLFFCENANNNFHFGQNIVAFNIFYLKGNVYVFEKKKMYEPLFCYSSLHYGGGRRCVHGG